jgi:excisionase family DNA binding protein
MPLDLLAHAIPHLPRLLEVAHVAHRLSCSQAFVRRLIRDGRLAALRIGNRWRIEEADLVAYIAACKVAHVKPGDDRAPGREPTPAIVLQLPRAGV